MTRYFITQSSYRDESGTSREVTGNFRLVASLPNVNPPQRAAGLQGYLQLNLNSKYN